MVSSLLAADPALTIYNQNFAVIREIIPVELKSGVNRLRFTGATAHVEPESVILRDPSGKRALQILEQNYRADPVSVGLLLSLFEGKVIDFLVQRGDRVEVTPGRIVRSGYVPHAPSFAPAMQPAPYYQPQPPPGLNQPIVEVDGKLRFQLPGTPLFPALTDDTILKPAFDWVIRSDGAGRIDAEVCYVSGGLTWEADYNLVAPETGDDLEILGWVTMANHSGKTFENARIKLMAGDVRKLQPRPGVFRAGGGVVGGVIAGMPGPPPVTEKAFDEYHLYTLERPATLHDRETKQVEFVRAAGVRSKTIYVYDGARFDQHAGSWGPGGVLQDPAYGAQSNNKVWVMREFANSRANSLGMPLPRGRTRFYRRDTDGRLEFTGEDTIEHTPRDERIRVFTGAAFDLAGERRRVSFNIDHGRRTIDESFEIKVRNRKSEAVQVRAVERLYRWITWEIPISSTQYKKTDSQTIEFEIPLQPDEEKTVTYAVRYTW